MSCSELVTFDTSRVQEVYNPSPFVSNFIFQELLTIQVANNNYLYCFGADSTVQLANGEEKRMDKLELNDFVKSLGEDFTETSVFPITGWLHRMEEVDAEFIV